MLGLIRFFALAAGLGVGLAGFAAAQEDEVGKVASFGVWSVFEADNPVECWAAAEPSQRLAATDPSSPSLADGASLLMVMFRPDEGRFAEFAFTLRAGEMRDGVPVDLQGTGIATRMISRGAWAWLANSEEDATILTTLASAQDVTMTYELTTGQQLRDVFSMDGFAEAVTEANRLCQAG